MFRRWAVATRMWGSALSRARRSSMAAIAHSMHIHHAIPSKLQKSRAVNSRLQKIVSFHDSKASLQHDIVAESSTSATIPAMADILAVAENKGVSLELKSFGPFFQVVAMSSNASRDVLGKASGFVKVWTEGLILHLDTVRMTKASTQRDRPLFGVALLIGALLVRHGLDCGCVKAELLAINDNDLYHSKLVRYYKRLGFMPVYEVTGESLQDLPHMLIWGGIGTRMDASILDLLTKWSSYFITKPENGDAQNIC